MIITNEINIKIKGKIISCGIFEIDTIKKKGIFNYHDDYLINPNSYPIDPVNLPLLKKTFETNLNDGYFGIFNDMLPQGWNKSILLENGDEISLKKHAVVNNIIKIHDRPQNKYYLNEEQLADYIKYQIYKYKADATLGADGLKWTTIVSPLGGVRPKIFVQIKDNQENKDKLWIAKFGQKGESFDNPMVEQAMITLAAKCGITVPNTIIKKIEGENVFFTEYFCLDTIFLSAGTLFNKKQGGVDSHYHYEDLYHFDPNKEFFKRIIFTLCTKNLDDHAWNYGFLYDGKKLSLSPFYDMMPFVGEKGAELNGRIGNKNVFHSIKEIIPYADSFGSDITDIIETVKIIKTWKEHFLDIGVTQKDINYIQDAFQLTHECNIEELEPF